MKNLYFLLSLLFLAVSNPLLAQNDSIYFWKAGVLLEKRSIKPADLDSITFARPTVNLPHVTIGTQVWSTKNLDVTTYTDGTPIPQVTDLSTWASADTGAWCYYLNDTANGPVYGKLYNWYAVAGIYDSASLNFPALRKQLAPIGWHIPTDAEWTTLSTFLGGSTVSGGKMKEVGTTHWLTPNTGADNSSGFTAIPSGMRNNNGQFQLIGTRSNFWASNRTVPSGFSTSYVFSISSDAANLYNGYDNWTGGYAVRCVRN